MKKKFQTFKDEVNLFQLFISIWDGKIKIILITIISVLVGVVYNNSLPEQIKTLKYSLKINSSTNSEFIKFVPIYNFLNTAESDLTGISLTGLKESGAITPIATNSPKLLNEKILDKFIQELMDFEELIFTLKTNEKISKKISEFSNKDQERILFNYAKLFSINMPTRKVSSHILNFLWNEDKDVGREIIEKTLNLTLNNLIKEFYKELDDLLRIKINAVINQDKRQVAYLLEQSAIAKELNIADNQAENINSSQSNVSFNINTTEAYYLRGYKAIDMEIKLIEGRKYEFFQYLQKELEFIKKEETRWVDYNIYLLESNQIPNKKNTPINLKILIAAGLLAGILFVVISDALIFHINRRKKG